MKNAMQFLGIIVLAAAGFCMTACPTGVNPADKNNSDNENFSLATLKTPDGVKSVYLSYVAVNRSARAAADVGSISSLSYITSTGQNAPILFSTPSGKKQFIFDVTGVEQLGERCIIIKTTGYYEVTGTGAAGSYTVGPKVNTEEESSLLDVITQTSVKIPRITSVLIDMKNSKLYNFSEFYDNYGGRFMEGNIIYTLRSGTVYKIDLSTASVDSALQAVPLNNREFTGIGAIMLPYTINNTLLGNRYSNGGFSYGICLDVSGTIQPQGIKFPVLPLETFAGYTGEGRDHAGKNVTVEFFSIDRLIQDLNGKPYAFIAYSIDNNQSPLSGAKKNYLTAEVSIDNSGQCILNSVKDGPLSFSDNYSYSEERVFTFNAAGVGSIKVTNYDGGWRSFLNNGVLTPYTDGFIRLRPEVDGIKVESVELSAMPTGSLIRKSIISSENYLFWLEDKTIKRLKLETGSVPQNIYSNRIIDSLSSRDLLTASGRKLIFYQYAEGSSTEVHTYSLDMYNPDAQPELLATNNAEIRSIVELNF